MSPKYKVTVDSQGTKVFIFENCDYQSITLFAKGKQAVIKTLSGRIAIVNKEQALATLYELGVEI